MKKIDLNSRAKTLSASDISGDSSRGDNLSDSDPQNGTVLLVKLENIVEYDFNPRRADNRKRDDILTSIRKSGFTGTFDITRRPGDTQYRPFMGGNTNLSCLKQIHQETGDYEELLCVFHEWESETRVRVNHLMENHSRDDLIYVDYAAAIMKVWRDFEEIEGTSLSQAKVSQRIFELGHTISQTLICRMKFTIDYLYPLIPKTLNAGMSQTKARNLNTLHSALEEYLKLNGVESKMALHATYDALGKVLTGLDGLEWEVSSVTDSISKVLEAELDRPSARIKMDLETLISKGLKKGLALIEECRTEKVVEETIDKPEFEQPPSAKSFVDDVNKSVPEKEKSSKEDLDTGDVRGREVSGGDEESTSPIVKEESPTSFSVSKSLSTDSSGNGLEDQSIDELRRLSREQVHRLLEPYDLALSILDTDAGFGFLIDLPESPIADEGDPSDVSKRIALWWVVACMSQQFAIPAEELQAHLSEHSQLYDIMEEVVSGNNKGTLIRQYVSNASFKTAGRDLFCEFTSDEESTYFCLMSLTRIIRGRAVNLTKSVWEI